ncbi:MAG: hypothetical protein J5I98_12365 [Phaeodactylibacter sp.]|nr:hypothetical protein [Phaeodactylibacter sp.]
MRNYIYLRYALLSALLPVTLSAHASITFRVFTGGPQAGEVHIDSPEGHYIYFRQDFRNDEAPGGFCGIRWSAPGAGELAWYWGNPGRMAMPSNGAPTRELSYTSRYSSCSEELSHSLFHTPSTPDGQAPPGAHLLVVEAAGWENVTFTNHRLQPLPFPEPKSESGTPDICRRYPGFCEYSPGLERAYDDPCQHATYGNLICKLLPAAQSGLIRTIDLANSMAGLQDQMEEDVLLIYSNRGLKRLQQAAAQSQERLALIQHQFRQLHDIYRQLDVPLKQISNLPFSHYAHTTLFTHLDLAKAWLDRCQENLMAIRSAAENKQPPHLELERLKSSRQRACHHLEEAQFWMERQYAWVVPMER